MVIRLHIWWANLARWLYEVTHEKVPSAEDDAWVAELQALNAETRRRREVIEKDGVTYKRVWYGLVKA